MRDFFSKAGNFLNNRGGGGGSLPSNVGGLDNSILKGGIGDLGYSGFKYDTSAFNNDFFTNKGRQGISNRDSFGGGNSPFSGENALKGFKSLLDVSNALGDRRQGSYQQNPFGNLFAGSRGGAGGMQLSSGPFGTTTYFPDSPSQGYGGYGGKGKEPSRFAKVASGAAGGYVACGGNPVCAAVGGIGGFFS